jgi:hypothetical protein
MARYRALKRAATPTTEILTLRVRMTQQNGAGVSVAPEAGGYSGKQFFGGLQ